MSTVESPHVGKSGYIPSLDGWRAVAIFGVLMTHDLPIYVGGHSLRPYQGTGGWSVYLFFAVSGILVCGRILDNEQAVGHFDLWAFYVRRIFRIQPASLFYLLCIGLISVAGVCSTSLHAWVAALLLYTNFLPHPAAPLPTEVFVGHFWTLAVEEHFYVLLSLLLFFSRRNRILVFAIFLGALLGFQGIARSRHLFAENTYPRVTLWQLQYLIFPALCALLVRTPQIGPVVRKYLQPWVAFAITFDWFLMYVGVRRPGAGLLQLIGNNINVLLYTFPLWVLASMYHSRSWTTRLLELAPLRFLGRLSYSLYLWHVFFFELTYPGVHFSSRVLQVLAMRPWRYVAAGTMALVSYYVVEKPMIRLGHRLAPPATPGHKDLAGSAPLLGGHVQGQVVVT